MTFKQNVKNYVLVENRNFLQNLYFINLNFTFLLIDVNDIFL